MSIVYSKHWGKLISMGIAISIISLGYMYLSKGMSEEIIEEEQVVVIPAIFLCDEATLNKSNAELVKEFNTLYKDKYYLDVEWFTGNATDYRARLKMLNSVDELPAIITDIGFDPTFYQLLVDNGQIINLEPYFTKDSSWQECFSPEIIEAVTEEDGKIYMLPLDTTYYSGVFWNKELFMKAGISQFPTTWEAFWDACNKLQEVGITPLSLHTEGTSWASMLLATSFLGSSEEGRAFMKQVFPETYNVKCVYEMLEVYKKAFNYTTEDAIGRNFDVAEQHFYLEETAMIPNGRWMVESFKNNQYAAEDFADKISFAPFPENVLIGSPEMSGWAVSSNYDQAVKDGAIEFLKFRNLKDYSDTQDLLEPQVYCNYPEVLRTYFDIVEQPFKLIPNYQLKWNSLIQTEVFSQQLPQLINENITIEDFVVRLEEVTNLYNKECVRN